MTTHDERYERLARVRYVADLMDARFRIAGIRFGLDSLVGLVPWLGDAVTGLVAVYVIWEAYRIGLPSDEISRMITRVLVDVFVGGIPIVGDLFDLFYKANLRNVRSIDAFMETQRT